MRGIELLPDVSMQRRGVENMIIECMQKRHATAIIAALRVFYLEHALYPQDLSANIYCFEGDVGKLLLGALGHAVQTGYTEGVIVLFEEKRAEQLLKCVVAESADDHQSLILLQKILRLSQNSNAVADLYKEMFDCSRTIKPSDWIDTMQALVLNDSIHTEIEHLEHKPRNSRGKKI